MNYFELFELPVTIRVDKALLNQRYFELQKKYHPDFYTRETEYEQSEALELSSQVNKAYKTFKNEDETIKYLLQLKNMLEDDEKFQLPADFLMEVMELNEDFSDDSADQVQQLSNTLHGEAKDIIENYNDNTVTPQQLALLKEYYFKKKYLQRILDRMAD